MDDDHFIKIMGRGAYVSAPVLWLCEICGNAVADQPKHDAFFHKEES